MSQNNGQDTTLKNIGVAALGVIIFALLYNLILGGGSGFGFEMHYGQGTGLNLNNLLGGILVLAVKLLWLVLVVSLVLGFVSLIKKLSEENKIDLSFMQKIVSTGTTCPECGTYVNNEFKFCPNCKANLKQVCANCGTQLQAGWKCCPSCGTTNRG